MKTILATLFLLNLGLFILAPTVVAVGTDTTDATGSSDTTGLHGGSDVTDDTANGGGGTRTVKLLNPLKVDTLAEFLNLVLDIVILIAVPIIIFFIIWSGFMYVTAQGKPEKIADATRAFTWTVVGAVILLGAKVLLAIITNTVKALSI